MGAAGGGVCLLGLLLLTTLTLAGRTPRGVDFKTINPRGSDIRLPGGLVPVSYFLQIQPFLEQDTFRGHVFINVTVTDDLTQRDVIILHAGPELKVKHMTLDEIYGGKSERPEMPAILSTERDTDNSLLYVRLSRDLVPGFSYRFGAEFSGPMNNKSHEGLFKGHYVNQETGNTHYYLAAHFKPSFARNVFPCFDEPALKASVTVSIARPKNTDLRTISNMPHSTTLPMLTDKTTKNSRINDISWVWDTFEASPPMSTYAITFLTSDLVAGPVQEPETEVSVPLRVWSRPALMEKTEWARRLAPKALAHIEKQLRTRFPLPKIDLVALPGFNAPVPAENWGIVFYREGDILSGGGGYNRWVTSYVVNELVFQWVGGLVTPHWWTDTWVNRALANFLARSAAAEMEPMDERLTHEQAPAAAVYALYYEYSKRSPYARLPSMRDIIAATKAEVIIRMLNYTLTEETFMSSLQDFLSEKSYTTYEQGDLWGSIGRRAHEDGTLPLTVSARAVAATWMGSERFPVLSVTRDYQGGLGLHQRAFIRDPVSEANDASAVEDDDNDGPEGLWWIPVVMSAHARGGVALDLSRHAPAFWMPPTRRIDNLSDPAQPSRFLIVNPEDIGLFLVNYDKRNWQMLAEYLTREESRQGPGMVPPTTRAKLVHDALNLALGGILDFPTAFSMTRFLATEIRYEPWHPFFNMADVLVKKLDGTAAGKLFGEYAVTLAAPLDKSLGDAGLGGEPAWRGKLRSHTRHLLCALGYEPCVQKARDIFARWIRSETPDANIPIPTRVFCAVFAWGTRDEWLFGLERLNRLPASKSAADRMYLLKTLSGCARDTWRIEKLLNVSVLQDAEPGSEPFSEADLRLIFGELAGRHSGYLTLFRFLEKNWDVLKDSFHGRPHLWTALVGAATGHFKTYDELQMVSELHRLRRGQFGAAEGAVRRAMERVELEAAWSQRHLASIQGWLLDQLAA